jgi:hypothetical protein
MADVASMTARVIALGFKKNTAGGLTPAEEAELQRLQMEIARAKMNGAKG